MRQPANPAFDAAKAAADGLGPAEVATIQRALIWTGDLNTMASGEFGKRSFEAIRAFQRRLKAADTGILRRRRAGGARQGGEGGGRRPSASGRSTEQGVSARLSGQARDAARTEGRYGPKFSSPSGNVTVDILRYPAATETGDALFERLKAERPGRKVTYSLSRPDAFVITGTVDGKSFYMRFLRTASDTRGFVLGWDPALSPGLRPRRHRHGGVDGCSRRGRAGDARRAGRRGAPARRRGCGEAGRAAACPCRPAPPGRRAAASGSRSPGGATWSRRPSLVAGCLDVTAGSGGGRVIAGDAATGLALVRLAGDAPAGLALRAAPLAAGRGGDGHRRGRRPSRPDHGRGRRRDPASDTRRFAVAGPAGPGALPGAIVDGEGASRARCEAGSASAVKPLFLAAFLRANGRMPQRPLPAAPTGPS